MTVIMIVPIVLGFILLAAGITGCVLLVIPGPPSSYTALILLSIARKWETFSPAKLIFSNRPDSALKAGWGVFLATMPGIAPKLPVSGVIAFYFTRAVLTG